MAPDMPLFAPLRIVFFGPPASGKTQLLRAVAAFAGKGAEEAPIELTHPDGNALKALIPLQMIVDLPGPKAETGEVHFLDCDGRAAARLLEQPEELRRTSARDELRNAIRYADAIVLAVDVMWDVPELRENLRQFQLFLGALEGVRTFDREAGGMPIFLALTKCDALKRPQDSNTQWLSRVTRRQSEVLDHFHDLFDDRANDLAAFEFGSLNLEVKPTAAQMPFGIEDLATSLLAAARANAERTRNSERRLIRTAGGLVSLFAAFFAVFAAMELLGPPSALEKLTADVQSYRDRAAPAEVRFADANFAANRRQVQALIDSPEYEKLPGDLRGYLLAVASEFDRYREYRERFQPPQFSPAEVRTAGEFQKLQTDLETILLPPPEYREAWRETQAVRLHAKWQRDSELLQSSEDQLHGWYRELIRRATQSMLVERPSASWRESATALFQESSQLPYPATEPIPGSPKVNVPRGKPLTYAAVYGYERVASAERDWESTSRKLRDLVQLCEALGMIAPGEGKPSAVLVLPENGDSLRLAGERLERLKAFYPDAMDGTANWNASNFPDPIRQELLRRLRLSVEVGVRHVQRVIRKELPESDTRNDWRMLDERTLNAPELRAWGTFLQKLSQWADQSRGNPVEELSVFLKRERFEWPVEKFALYLPNALRVEKLLPDGSFTVTVTPREGLPRVTLFRDAKPTNRDAQGTVWQFTAPAGTPAITYEPGDAFAVEVALRSADSQFELKWNEGRTNTYRFDRIASEPVLVKIEQPAGLPQRATGVKLTMLSESAAIRVPVLIPALPGVK